MARKRMFDSEIINQDSFLEMPMDAKALYFLLGMEADDEGFVSYKRVLRLYGGSEDSIKILATKNYIIPFKTGVIVITDWKRNNYLDKNRIKETIYQSEKSLISFNKDTEKYELTDNSNSKCLTDVKHTLNQYRIEENRREEISIDKSSSSVNKNLYNPEIQKLQQVMIETIGTTNINNIKECVNYLDKLPFELIEYALRKTARIERPSWQYTIPILESYIDKGFQTVDEVKADDLKHKTKNNSVVAEETNEEKVKRKLKALEEAMGNE